MAVITDAGHSPQFENPDGWWSALTEFLDRIG
jgi:pimeloyl-ACP methyl ester carboxylesterase